VRSFRLAVAFLTIVPVRLAGEPAQVGSAAPWFPLVGAVLGAVAGGVVYVTEPSLGRIVAAILGVGLLVVLSGGLHQDGLADCADALGGTGDRDRRLAILRDSSIGTFGGLALIFWSLVVVAGVGGLDRGDVVAAVMVAATVGRWSALVHAISSPAAREDGLGAGFVVGGRAVGLAGAGAAVVALGSLGPARGAGALAVAGLVGLGASAASRRALGGRTGDTLGACVAISEAAVIVMLLASASSPGT
jgi:adenosylcobinamide-GDP ribazoletransferase